jgi:hypothetical protein
MGMTNRRIVFPVAVVAVVMAACAAFFLVDWNPERTRREAFIKQCNEEGAGGMFTSREYCEELYARTKAGRAAGNSN